MIYLSIAIALGPTQPPQTNVVPVEIEWKLVGDGRFPCDSEWAYGDWVLEAKNFTPASHPADVQDTPIGWVFQRVKVQPKHESCGGNVLFDTHLEYFEMMPVLLDVSRTDDSLGSFLIGHDVYGFEFKTGESKLLPAIGIDANGQFANLDPSYYAVLNDLLGHVLDPNTPWNHDYYSVANGQVIFIKDPSGNCTHDNGTPGNASDDFSYWCVAGDPLHSGDYPNGPDLPPVTMPGNPQPGDWGNDYHGHLTPLGTKILYNLGNCCDAPGIDFHYAR